MLVAMAGVAVIFVIAGILFPTRLGRRSSRELSHSSSVRVTPRKGESQRNLDKPRNDEARGQEQEK